MTVETLQQGNLFTGAWEVKRTASSRLEQTPLFSLNETFEFGAKIRPQFVEVRRPTLELTREDVRTAEEVERDLMREAEERTSPLFASEGLQENGKQPEPTEPDSKTEPAPALPAAASEKSPKLSSYLALVNLAHEQAVTLWVDAAYRGRFYAQLPQAVLSAHSTGLTDAEIGAALHIGEVQGKQEREAGPPVSGVIVAASGAATTQPTAGVADGISGAAAPAPYPPSHTTRSTPIPRGYTGFMDGAGLYTEVPTAFRRGDCRVRREGDCFPRRERQ